MGNMCPFRHVVVTNEMVDGGTVIPRRHMRAKLNVLVGLIDATVRPIEDTPWIPVVRETHEAKEEEEDTTIPRAYREKLVPLKVDLPPSLLPVHSSVFENTPPCEWG